MAHNRVAVPEEVPAIDCRATAAESGDAAPRRWRLTASAQVVAAVAGESRPAVQGIMALRFTTAMCLTRYPQDAAQWCSGAVDCLIWIAAMTAVYVANGLSDLEADRRNGSMRPLARGTLAPRDARAAVAACAAVSLAGSLLSPGGAPVDTLAVLTLGAWYSFGRLAGKRHSTTTILIVVLGGLLAAHAGVTAAGGHPTEPALLVAASMALWMGVGAIVKDLSDVPGDRAARRRTWVLTLGARRSCQIAVMMAALALMPVLTGSLFQAVLLIPAAVLAAGGFLVAHACQPAVLASAPDGARAPYRTFMRVQYAAHAVCIAAAAGGLT
jgi:4-hydroxybenzoate polyprenyltransferase